MSRQLSFLPLSADEDGDQLDLLEAVAEVEAAPVVVTAATAVRIADEINAAFAAGTLRTVNGCEVVSRFGSPVARSWQNGTVSVTVKGRTKGKVNDLFVKVGKSLRTA